MVMTVTFNVMVLYFNKLQIKLLLQLKIHNFNVLQFVLLEHIHKDSIAMLAIKAVQLAKALTAIIVQHVVLG